VLQPERPAELWPRHAARLQQGRDFPEAMSAKTARAIPNDEDRAMNEDELRGTARDVGGKLRDAAGGLTGDTGMQAQAKLD